MVWMFVSPKKIHVDILKLLGDEASERWLGHEERALMDGIRAPSTMWGHNKETAICKWKVGSHQSPILLAPWAGTSSHWNCCQQYASAVCKPPSLWSSATAAWMGEDTILARSIHEDCAGVRVGGVYSLPPKRCLFGMQIVSSWKVLKDSERNFDLSLKCIKECR